MKKVSLIVLDSFREVSLEKLREIGILHLDVSLRESSALSSMEEKRTALERALLLVPFVKTGIFTKAADLERCLQVAEKASILNERERGLREELGRLARSRTALEDWGDFSPDDIENLRARGIFVRLFILSREEYAHLPEYIDAFIISETKTNVMLAIVSLQEQLELPGSEMPLPSQSLSDLRKRNQEIDRELERIQEEWNDLASERALLQSGVRELDNRIDFERARVGMEVDGPLATISGYVPTHLVERIEEEARTEGWAVLVEEPVEDDHVPTLVRNSKWIRIIKPVFDFLGTVPGYREYDISFWFLLFLSVFFAMIVGDAGYGAIFLLLTFLLRIKIKKAPAEPFFLLAVFSACTLIWGAITGTWFGSEALVSPTSPLSKLVINSIASFPKNEFDSGKVIMYICFLMGAVHISIAHIKNFVRNLPRFTAFAQLGWLSIVWGMYFVIQVIVLRREASDPALAFLPGVSLMTAGIVLVVFGLGLVTVFGEQKGNFFKGIAMGFAWLPLRALNSISAFSDVVSYVRLFAVGLATVKVAESFNAMALGVGFGFPAGLGGVLILFFGHALNIVMGSLSIIVHGVRLNVLEFSTHLGMEWTGTPYSPFRKNEDVTAERET
ncbi:MAG TPA: V-type ATP synthase subunit I [Spirochaetia bacterium]|nr:V-type ATP synthase subunit I [Spirochaetia bacterium]